MPAHPSHRSEHGRAAFTAFYEALWTEPDGTEREWIGDIGDALHRCGLPAELVDVGGSDLYDAVLRASHHDGVDRIDAEIGTPVLVVTGPDGDRGPCSGRSSVVIVVRAHMRSRSDAHAAPAPITRGSGRRVPHQRCPRGTRFRTPGLAPPGVGYSLAPEPQEPTTMPDIIRLILDDHESFRARFAELEKLREDATAAAAVWAPLAAELEVHATAEEEFFYPQLLKRVEGMEDETEDAVSDHDEIRQGIRRAAAAELDSDEWWAGIQDAREANDEHLAEEERDDLAPFLEKASLEVRQEVGEKFAAFKREHAHAAGLDYSDTDSDKYMEEHT